ncbi:hypothetical protein C7T35_15520 [Variovorax sp. WS11]|uniref:HNH endonuclease n=1 Tax=Variovorax sp. WS11 TaxID=1105204 RepID=UPI000D0CFE01|nr:HNH endonuclease signature motif containing protein [Variovorax sp. WS11]NDZ12027.1 HNH endonuclease [Variovorax sp. WS11]PSL83787.1 hypothetical protein C7T35_15520 [Variovorax sp. WS11]
MKSRLQKYRTSAIQAQRGRCIYCRQPMGRDATAEHLCARQDGGTDRKGNIVAACRRCNHRRHADKACAGLSAFDYSTLVELERVAGIAESAAPSPRKPSWNADSDRQLERQSPSARPGNRSRDRRPCRSSQRAVEQVIHASQRPVADRAAGSSPGAAGRSGH